MTERTAIFQQVAVKPPTGAYTGPILYLSSKQAAWEDLVAEAFLEPPQLQGWQSPAAEDIRLMLFAGGPLYLDRRYEDSLRTTAVMVEGDLYLRPDSVTPYEISWNGISSLPTRTLNIHLTRSLLTRTAEEITGYDPAHLSLARRECFQDAQLKQIGFAIWKEIEQPTPAGALYAQTAAQMLAVHLLRYYTSTPLPIKEAAQLLTQRQLKRVYDFILADLTQNISLQDMAKQVGFSAYHFARLFRRTTGESPHQFVLRQRIEKAQHLLRETHTPLSHVALESGFADQSHLTHIFNRYLGLTPKAYRQRA